MRYQSALVLSILAVSQAVASNVRHASFHARRNDVEKRNADDVNWKRVAEDVYGLSPEEWSTLIDWKTVNYGGSSSTAAPQPTQAAVTAAAYQPQTTQDKPSSTSTSAPAATASASSGGVDATDLISGLTKFASLGVFGGKGINSPSSSGSDIWLGSDGKYMATFVNDASRDAAVICWKSTTMWINAHQPDIYVHLAAGQKTTVSIPYGFSGGCGVAFEDSNLSNGLLNESILEFTAKPKELGCFDVSREINMKGIVLGVKGSQCTSGVKNGKLACTFVCKSGDQCGTSGSYIIEVGAETKGPCMTGQLADGNWSGGCQMGDGEHMEVTIYGNRAWPS